MIIGIADSVLELVASALEALLLATPEPTSITDAYALLKTLNRKSEFSIDDNVIKTSLESHCEDGEEI